MTADLVFTGGAPGSVAVRGGRIVAVGGPEVLDLVGRSTEVVDLAGGLLLPGFQDAHLHPLAAGLELAQCDLSAHATLPAYQQALARYARAEPDRTWLTGGGWSMEVFPRGMPHREQLDAVVADRPVYLPNRDHHGAWVNTRALQLAGVDAATPDPADGRIERDPDGTPTGLLQEGAMDLVARLLPPVDDTERLDALLAAQARMHAVGVTAWQDAAVGADTIADPTDAYRAARRGGLLSARVVAALWWDRHRGAEQIDDLLGRRERLAADGVPCPAVKIMLDGVAENHTAAMLSPYVDPCGGGDLGSGLRFVDADELRAHVTALDGHGFSVHFHALGDRAVRDALDAVEAARRVNGRSSARHQLAHLQVVHPDDVPRFAALGAVANVQPLWAAHEPQMDELTRPYLTPRRAAWQYPFGALHRSGAMLACGSDWPVSSPDPLEGIQVAATRRLPGAAPQTPAFLPDQRLDVATAVAAYTAGSAYANHLDADTGRIAVGWLADLVVLDRDVLTRPAEEIAEARVVQTYVGGRRVHPASTPEDRNGAGGPSGRRLRQDSGSPTGGRT